MQLPVVSLAQRRVTSVVFPGTSMRVSEAVGIVMRPGASERFVLLLNGIDMTIAERPQIRAALPDTGTGRVSNEQCPTLLITGSGDVMTPPRMGGGLASSLRRPAELVKLPGVGPSGLCAEATVWQRVFLLKDDDVAEKHDQGVS